MKSRLCLYAALAAMLCATSAQAQVVKPVIEASARALIDKMAARYKAARSYSDVMTLSSKWAKPPISAPPDEWNFRAQVAWQKPNRARIVKYAANFLARSSSDGKLLRAVTPRHKGYYLQRAANFNSIGDAMNEIGVGAPGLVHIMDAWGVARMEKEGLTSLRMAGRSMVDGVPTQRVIGRFAFHSGEDVVETLEIGIKDGLLHRVTQQYSADSGGGTFVETHSQIKIDPVLPVSTFAFVLPRGARPIDYYSRLTPDKFKPKVKVGEMMPPFQAVDLDGKPVALSDFGGRAVILHFFSTHESTASDVPEMVRIHNRYKNQGLVVIGISMDARRERLEQLVAKEKVPYPIVFDGKGRHNEVAKFYGVRSLPTTLLIGRDGKLRQIADRPRDMRFKPSIRALLEG